MHRQFPYKSNAVSEEVSMIKTLLMWPKTLAPESLGDGKKA